MMLVLVVLIPAVFFHRGFTSQLYRACLWSAEETDQIKSEMS